NTVGDPVVAGFGAAVTPMSIRGRTVTFRSDDDTAPDSAVIVASAVLVSVVRAKPAWSVFVVVGDNVPAVVLNAAGMPGRAVPGSSSTRATTSTLPPVEGRVCGFAVRMIRLAAAEPTSRVRAADEAPPEWATMLAVPLASPEMNLTRTSPLWVRDSL